MFTNSIRRSAAPALAALLLSGVAGSALAGAFALREQSTVGQGMSFAGVAAGGGDSISGMFWNPALVNQVGTFQSEQHVTGVLPSSKIKADGSTKAAINAITGGQGATGDSGEIGQGAILASGYNAYRINDRVAVGLSVTSPFGLVTDPRKDWSGQFLARSSKVLTINATPTVGYIVNDWISVAAGLQVQYFDISLKRATPLPAPFTPGSFLPGAGTTRLSGDDIGFGFVAGLNLKPWDGADLGVGYRSATSYTLKGKLRSNTPLGSSVQNIKAKVDLPDSVTVGLRQRVSDSFTALVGFEWTNWEQFDSFAVKNRNTGAKVTDLPFHYKDGYFLSVGGEYKVTEDLTARAGVAYEWSPINTKNRTVRLPDNDRWWLSAGASYGVTDRIGVDLGYSYVFVPGKTRIREEFAPGLPFDFRGTSKSDVHIVSAAVRYAIGSEAPPALVTKY
ncbi:OmpP1/FadL family transporter [Methylopila musalis]|uniref:OmpP1/FadL family transporter n=1 Tax=Methylopila musalis TaxID=1134781 RepID=A0ABW3ZAX6_9HYPH